MPSLAYNKAKGTAAEVAVAEHAKARGFCLAHRKARTGAKDEGDVWVSELVQALEVKNTKACDISGFLTEARVEADHAGSPYAAAVWKRARKSVGDWAVLLTYDDFLNLLAEASTPTEHNVLWRSLYSKALDDNEALRQFIVDNGLGVPYTTTAKVPEVTGS